LGVIDRLKKLDEPSVISSAFPEQKLLSRIIKQAGLEGSREVIIEALNILCDQGVLGENATAAEIIDRLAYSGVVGAAMGGGIQGAIEGVRSLVGSRKQAPVPVCAAQALERPAAATPFDPANRPQGARTPIANPAALPPSEVARQQFLAERGLTEQGDGSFTTQDGVQLDPADGQRLSTFLAEVDEAVADLEAQDVPVTPDTVRRELQIRQRMRDLEAERATARTPEAKVRTVPPPLHPLCDRIWLWKVPPANKLAA